jgi:hypothetical protein
MIGALTEQLTGKQLPEPVSITQNNLIAYFPQALVRNSELLSSSYHDIPKNEPELIQELLRIEKLNLRSQAAAARHVCAGPGSLRMGLSMMRKAPGREP